MNETRIGIIGCGIIGEDHARKYKEVPGARVVAACDIDEAKLNALADAHGVERRFTHIGRMLREADIDSVDVCLHNNLHAPVSIEAMRRGKNVYCEKPMAGSWADAKAMMDAAAETGRMLHVQLAFLYHDETRAAKRLIDAGRLGTVYHLRSYGYRRRGRPYLDGYATKEFVNAATAAGGALFDMGVYHISQLLWLTGMPALERVTGHTYAETDADPARARESGYNVEELGCGFATYAGGLTMDVLESWAIHLGPFPGSMMAGSKGGLTLAPLSFHSTVEDLEMDATFNMQAMRYRNDTVHAERERHHGSSQGHWVAAQQGACPLLPTARIALETQLLQEGIYISHRLEREVAAEEIRKLSASKAIDVPNLRLDGTR
jgi:predicted dehydrogenase